MLYVVRKDDLYVVCLDTARDSYISFQKLNESLFGIGGALLYNFTDLKHIFNKLDELNLNVEDFIILNFEELLELLLKIQTEGEK